jgi:hypothetical protein
MPSIFVVLRERRQRAGRLHGSEPRMVVGDLHRGIAAQHRIELHDVRVVPGKLVRRAIATKHDVSGHGLHPHLPSLPAIANSSIGRGQPLDAGGMFAQSVPLIHKQGCELAHTQSCMWSLS